MPEPFDQLLDAYLADPAAEHRALAEHLRTDPQARRRLVTRSMAEAHLRRACRSTLDVRRPAVASHWSWSLRLVAALALLGIGLLIGRSIWSPTASPYAVLEGAVLVDGVAGAIRDGAILAVADNRQLLLELPDGSQASFQPGCEFVLDHQDDGEWRQRLQLLRGQAGFEIAEDPRRFEIATEAGRVVVLGTSFTLAYQPGETGYLDVQVRSGRVRVDHDKGSSILGSGEEQAFTRQGPQTRRHRGRLISWDAEAGTVHFRSGRQDSQVLGLHEHCQISCEDHRQVAEALVPGAMIEATLDAGQRITRLTVLRPRLKGVLLAIDPGRGLLTIAESSDSAPATYPLAITARISAGRKRIAIEELEVGDSIQAVLSTDWQQIDELERK